MGDAYSGIVVFKDGRLDQLHVANRYIGAEGLFGIQR